MGNNAKKRRQAKFEARQAAKASATVNSKKRPKIPFAPRPFEGLKAEVELVGMRELFPAAILTLKTNSNYGSTEFDLVTLLPGQAPALLREDGRLLVAAQTLAASADTSHDLAMAVLAGLRALKEVEVSAENAQPITVDVLEPGPRLQDILDPDFPIELQIFQDFSFWLNPEKERTEEVEQALAKTAGQIVPVTAIPEVVGAFHFDMGSQYVRWIRTEDSADLENALAQLQAKESLNLGEDSRFLGIFRSYGLLIPVFEVNETNVTNLTEPLRVLGTAITSALESDNPLNDAERRAKAGILSRQVTIR